MSPRKRKLKKSYHLILLTIAMGLTPMPAWAQRSVPIPVPPPRPANPQPVDLQPLPFPSGTVSAPAPATPSPRSETPEETDSPEPEASEPEEGNGESGNGEEPKLDPNPLNSPGNQLDTLIEQGINADLWEAMKGDLACVEATPACASQLQAQAIAKNPLLKEIDTRIEEASARIEEAKARNQKQVLLSVLSPGLQALLRPQTTTTTNAQGQPQQQQTTGFLGNILSIFTNPVSTIDRILGAIGVPLLERLVAGGNAEAQRNAIATSELAIQLAQLQRGRAEAAQKIREQVYLVLFEFDDRRREFQIAREVAKREQARVRLVVVRYRFGNGTTDSYLATLNAFDGKKAQTYRAWAGVRSSLEKLKLLVLGVEE
jgi:hypothetical protein